MTRRAHDAIEAEAARWILRRDREGDTPELRAEIDDWISQDPRRAGTLLSIEAAWATLDGLADTPAGREDIAPRVPDRRRVWGGAGIVAVAAGLALFLLPSGPRTTDYAADVGEVRQVRLDDDSRVAINTGGHVGVVYSDDGRSVTLDDGEAWFRVVKNPARPFVVAAGPVRVEAVGTAFAVRRRAGGADVLVTEGVVRAWVVGEEDSARLVHAGTGLFMADDATVPRELDTAAAVERQLAWRDGRLDLAGDTLASAVAEINRYNRKPIVVADPALGARQLHGRFALDDPVGFARTAATALGGAAEDTGETIVIRDTRK